MAEHRVQQQVLGSDIGVSSTYIKYLFTDIPVSFLLQISPHSIQAVHFQTAKVLRS